MVKINRPNGFTNITVIIAGVVVIAIAAVGVYVANHQDKPTKSSSTSQSTDKTDRSKPNIKPVSNPYEGWQTYTDTGYSASSGINIKYPSDWQVKVGASNSYAWQVIQNAAPNSRVGARIIFLPTSNSPQQEWENCPSADACGPAPNSTEVSGVPTKINGLDAYKVQMKTDADIQYYATIVKGQAVDDAGNSTFVELIISNPDAASLDIYNRIVNSANF